MTMVRTISVAMPIWLEMSKRCMPVRIPPDTALVNDTASETPAISTTMRATSTCVSSILKMCGKAQAKPMVPTSTMQATM